MEAVSILNAMFPSGSFVSFREFLSRDQVQGRSLDDLARSLSGASQSIYFCGYFSLSTNVCISQVLPPYQSVCGHVDLLESNSLPTLFFWNDSSHFSLFWKLCFLQTQHPKVQLSMSSAYFKCVTLLSQARQYAESIQFSHFPMQAELERWRIYKCCMCLSDKIFGMITEDPRGKEFSGLCQVTFWI